MGSTASPEICDITLHEFEQKITYQAEQILTWWWYRDDILVYTTALLRISKT